MKYQEEDDRKSLNKEKISKRNLSFDLEKKLNKIYQPKTRFDETFRGKDITYITNENGEPITLYVGKRKENGKITGEVFYRRIKKRQDNLIIDSHWDNQGKVSGS